MLNWHATPRATTYGVGLVVADIHVTKDTCARVVCEEIDKDLVEAMILAGDEVDTMSVIGRMITALALQHTSRAVIAKSLLRDAIQLLAEHLDWVPVSDARPSEAAPDSGSGYSELVLVSGVFDGQELVCSGWYDHHRSRWHVQHGQWNTFTDTAVTHWKNMPLPASRSPRART